MKNKNNGGFIKMTLIIVAALVILKYAYDIDVVGFLTQGRFKELLDQFYNLGSKGWAKYSEFLIKAWDFCSNLAKNLIDKIKS